MNFLSRVKKAIGKEKFAKIQEKVETETGKSLKKVRPGLIVRIAEDPQPKAKPKGKVTGRIELGTTQTWEDPSTEECYYLETLLDPPVGSQGTTRLPGRLGKIMRTESKVLPKIKARRK